MKKQEKEDKNKCRKSSESNHWRIETVKCL